MMLYTHHTRTKSLANDAIIFYLNKHINISCYMKGSGEIELNINLFITL